MSDPSKVPPQDVEYGKLSSYVVGFLASVALTCLAFYLAIGSVLQGWLLEAAVVVLAVGQALIQLLLFFNLMREPHPRWNLLFFLFTLMVVVILIIGSLWIMENLNYNLMGHEL